MAPYAFEAACILRDRGILMQLEESDATGVTVADIAAAAGLPLNSTYALLEAGLGVGIISGDNDRFYITMAGQYFLQDVTVRTNSDFMRDICLPGIAHLEESLETASPTGLQAFGDWKNVFEALPELPADVRQSWYAFNNHHSDAAFADALPIVLAQHPERILDLGGSTGRFALAAIDRDDEIHVGIADLNPDEAQLEPGVAAVIRAGRVSQHSLDVLADVPLPQGYDTIWMSQFLPCFSEEQIEVILAKCAAAIPDGGNIWLMETFWDRQRYEAAAASLQMTSLYFVNIATGVSRMWRSEKLLAMIQAAGFIVESQHDRMGRGHTLLQLQKTR